MYPHFERNLKLQMQYINLTLFFKLIVHIMNTTK